MSVEAPHLLGDLDEQQRAAVTTESTLVAVVAAAGSGKTRVLARRIAYRVATKSADAGHTLALTFTREAAGELRRRLRILGLRDHVEAGTFHSVALGLLRQRWVDQAKPAPAIISDRERLIAEIADGTPVDVLATERTWSAARGIPAGAYVRAARQVNRRIGVPPDRIADALERYEVLKRRRGVVDLDDLLLLLSRDLATDVSFADATRWRFRHVLVDEAQDLNPVQYRILDQLTIDRRDLFLVGDPAQAIYAFNGSDPTLLTAVDRHLPGIEVVRLTTNRRCTPQVVAAGSHVLRASGQESDVVSARADGRPVEVVVATDEADEAARVAGLLRRMSPGRIHAGGIAVLARTHEQLNGLRRALASASVPMRTAALAPGSALAASVRDVTLTTSASQLRAWAHDVLDAPPDQVPEPLPTAALKQADRRVAAAEREHAARRAAAAERERADRRVAAAVLDFLREQPLGDGFALRAWIAATNPFSDPSDADGVELLTFHAAKGREWHTVVVTGVETGLVPHRSASTVDAKAEEARLLHVAFTRASDELVVTRAERRRGYSRQESPFIVGLPIDRAEPVRAPEELHRPPDPAAQRAAALRAWRVSAARAASLLPDQICSDDDLTAIATSPPSSAEELTSLTTIGPIAAARLFPPIRKALDTADTAGP
jgi:DNA helicase-2/ATP-dependent DNA helicase PcrA